MDKVLNNTKERFKSKYVSVSQFVERLDDNNSQGIVNNNEFSSSPMLTGYYKQRNI